MYKISGDGENRYNMVFRFKDMNMHVFVPEAIGIDPDPLFG